MDRQHRAVDGHGQPADVDRRRVEAVIENLRASTDVRLGADRDGRRLVAGDKVAAARIGLI
jgi:cell division FtsZ-interacting protein ZapD